MLAQTGARPRIFLANLGRLSDFTARAGFAKNFFEAGGIEAVTNDGLRAAMRWSRVKGSGARLACLCASDAVYASEAVAAAHALAAAGARLTLAGRPGEQEQALRSAGIDAFIFAGCDMLAALRTTHGAIAS